MHLRETWMVMDQRSGHVDIMNLQHRTKLQYPSIELNIYMRDVSGRFICYLSILPVRINTIAQDNTQVITPSDDRVVSNEQSDTQPDEKIEKIKKTRGRPPKGN